MAPKLELPQKNSTYISVISAAFSTSGYDDDEDGDDKDDEPSCDAALEDYDEKEHDDNDDEHNHYDHHDDKSGSSSSSSSSQSSSRYQVNEYIDRLREHTVTKLWQMTEKMNILYPANWTRSS